VGSNLSAKIVGRTLYFGGKITVTGNNWCFQHYP